jgi:proteasome lid subunit RPN8/RPN11
MKAYHYEVVIRRAGARVPLGREPVSTTALAPLADDAVFHAQRRGVIGPDRARATCDLEPVWKDGAPPRVASLRARVREDGACLEREYMLGVFEDGARALARRLLGEKRIKPDEAVETVVLAHEAEAEPRPAAPENVQVSLHQAPLALTPGKLSDWLARGREVNPEARGAADSPVFIERRVLEQAREYTRDDAGREAGALFVGRLFRQTEPEPEIFLAIEGCFAALHARRERFSLTFTPETYRHFERQLALRRQRLGRPEEVLAATAHSHPFAPSLSSKGEPNCPGCALRPTCKLTSAFISEDDALFHAALLARRPFGLAVIWGLDPRFAEVVKFFGFRDGRMAERSVWVVE